MVSFIDGNRREFGVEPICDVLPIAPSTYYAARSRQPSARAVRDAELAPRLAALWRANYGVYGARKLGKAARRAGIDVGRDQAARLMRLAGIEGVRRRRQMRTTRPDAGAERPADLVERDFSADRPNRLWVTDLTYVATWAGVAYVCFIVDAFSRRIVGWRVAAHMRTSMVLDALEMARASRGTRLAASWPAATPAASSPRCAGANASPSWARRRRSAASATATTTPSPRPSTASTRPNSSAAPPAGPGAASTTSNSPPSPGCTGTTPSASTATSATSPRQSSRPPTLPDEPTTHWLETNKPSLHQTQGDSSFAIACG